MGFLKRLVSRRPPVPSSAQRYLGKDERTLAWAQAETGQIVVATQLGLHIVGERAHRLVGWHQISKATWEDRSLVVIEARPRGEHEIRDERPWRLQFREPGLVPMVLRERVQSSVVVSVHRSLSAGGVRIVGRKVPGIDGLTWQYRPDDGVSFDSPAAQDEVQSALQAEIERYTPTDL